MIIKKKFDRGNINWDINPTFNQLFLRSSLQSFNDLLRAQGYVLLQEVYDKLGFKITSESCTHGWIVDVDKSIKVEISQNEDNIELTFDVHSILEYLEKEEAAE